MEDVKIVKFYAPWCTPCKVYAREFERATSKLGVKTFDINIDDENNHDAVRLYGVEKIPHTVIVKDGEIVDQFTGAISASRLTTRIEEAVK